MSSERKVEWEGKYLRIVRVGRWEYVERCGGVHAVVILAEYDGNIVIIEQPRTPLGERKCVELPAGLVGDEDPDATIEETAIKELEEETGFTADRIEVIGEFFSSPGMVAESFTLVRAHGLKRIGDGGGTDDDDRGQDRYRYPSKHVAAPSPTCRRARRSDGPAPSGCARASPVGSRCRGGESRSR